MSGVDERGGRSTHCFDRVPGVDLGEVARARARLL